ncbi:MAG: DMT family transporter [Actinobacteria bacterium]|nr:DMT family transporter [Actinomycetota bacterium]MCB8997317.1 DMT family transporter [Actinomycetota bacterium]MCB9414105.1 DMT family transporter [Actinomycetota bacterium]MCB9423627.1 DMT family transporter [Actinomycetota bacterium]
MSASAPLIAACGAPSLAIATYRCLLASGLTIGWMLLTSRRVRVPAGIPAAMGPGLALAAHFGAWIPSLRLTSVALSTAMISTQPVWSALLARFTGVRPAKAVWWGIAVSVVGVLVLTGFGGSVSGSSWIGMGLALLGALLAAVYVAFGERLRKATDLASYTTVVYGVAGLALLVVSALGSVALGGYVWRDWLLILAITLVAQIGGHSAMNAVVHRTSATVVSTAILFEAPGATILAAIFLGQSVGLSLVLGLVVMLIGLVIVVRGTSPRMPESGV